MSTPDDIVAELEDEQPTITHGVTREHLIVLCCAHSVVELVEEVARNLRGLGFAVEVVCGAEARTALLGRGTGGDEPTIYVVCVQGTLKEQVLKPLRQALATHGGPNQHLFVAVLDLALPLAMVGQIRRFSEALERPRRRGGGAIDERRQWREQLGPNTERVATRSYRAVEVVGRGETGPVPGVDAVRRTGPQAVIGAGRPAQIGATAKYRAVTGALPIGGEAAAVEETALRKRRRAHAPKVKVKPLSASGQQRAAAAARAAAIAPAVNPAVTGDTVVAPMPTAPVASATPSVRLAAEPAIATPPAIGIDAPMRPPRRSRWPIALVGVGVLGAASVGVWITGGAARLAAMVRGDASTGSAAIVAKNDDVPAANATPEPAIAAAPPKAKPPEPTPIAIEAPPPVPSIEPPAAIEPVPAPPAPVVPAAVEPAESPQPPDVVDDAPVDIEPAFEAAIAARKVRTTAALYVSMQRLPLGSWQQARAGCDGLEIGGVGGFRLPHRRELQGLDAAQWLHDEPHWSRTVPDDDTESAYVLHPSTGQLTVWSKEESASALCVRGR